MSVLRQPVYIDIMGICYQVDSITHDYGGSWDSRINATIEAHPVDKKSAYPFAIKKVIFNDPATIVLWADGTKTVVKCHEGDIYDKQTGLLMCMAKKMYGNNGKFNDILREWVPLPEEEYSPLKEFMKAATEFSTNYIEGFIEGIGKFKQTGDSVLSADDDDCILTFECELEPKHISDYDASTMNGIKSMITLLTGGKND